jgi:DNA polymerase III delta subunit
VIYFIHGPDRLLARQAALAIAAEVDPDGSNTSWVDGRETTPDRLLSEVGTATFFGSPRVVIVSDLLGRTAREANAGDPNSTDGEEASHSRATLVPVLSSVPDPNCLILLEPAMTSVPAAVKSVSPPVTVIAGEPPRGPALVAWIEDAARRVDSRIDRRTAQLLAETLFPQTWDRKASNPRFDRPPDMALVTQEIAKLALAAYPDPIGPEHVRDHVHRGPDQRVFRFLDASLGGDLRSAVNELERLASAGEEPAMLLAQLLGQMELATVAAAAGARDAGTVARDLGSISPGRMSAVMASVRRHSAGSDWIAAGVAADRRLKTGRTRHPNDALQQLILSLGTPSSERNLGRSG